MLNEGMAKILRRNKRLVIAERFGWPTTNLEVYALDPLADDTADEQRLKRAQKESKKARQERLRPRKVRMSPPPPKKKTNKKRNSILKKNLPTNPMFF